MKNGIYESNNLNCRENRSSLEITVTVISAAVGAANLKVLCHGSV